MGKDAKPVGFTIVVEAHPHTERVEWTREAWDAMTPEERRDVLDDAVNVAIGNAGGAGYYADDAADELDIAQFGPWRFRRRRYGTGRTGRTVPAGGRHLMLVEPPPVPGTDRPLAVPPRAVPPRAGTVPAGTPERATTGHTPYRYAWRPVPATNPSPDRPAPSAE